MQAVRLRMDQGREAYEDQSFTRPPEALAGEIKEELLDVCGWAFILRCRVAAIGTECAGKGRVRGCAALRRQSRCMPGERQEGRQTPQG